jgi:hypothetical protein
MTKGIDYEKHAGAGWLIAGYIFALLGGWIGLFIGVHLAFSKVNPGSGPMLKKFDGASRKNGNIIWILALIAGIGWIALMNSDNISLSDF